MNPIYRFTSFSALVDIIQRQEITLVSPMFWQDPYERYLFTAAKSASGQKKLRIALSKILTPENIESNFALLSLLDSAFFGQCWTKKAETDALWRIYSYENMAIRLEIDRDDITKLKDVSAHDVTYVPKIILEDEIAHSFSNGGLQFHFHVPFCTKRDAFSHEEEVRILSAPDLQNATRENLKPDLDNSLIKVALQAFYEKGEISLTQFQTGMANIEAKQKELKTFKRISFSHIPGFIKSIMLHPLAPNWFDETIATYCSNNRLPYSGKSKMYLLDYDA